MPLVVAWFCECGSIDRMSFCAAQRSRTAWAGAAASAATTAAAVRKVLALMALSSVDLGEAGFREVVGAVHGRDALLHRPGAHLVVQGHVVGLVANDRERLANHAVALLRVHLGLHQ